MTPVPRSRTNACTAPVVHGLARFGAADRNASRLPVALKTGALLGPLPATPPGPTLSQVAVPLTRSYTRICWTPLWQPAARFGAVDWNATNRPSAFSAGFRLCPFPGAPPGSTLTHSVVPASGSPT